MSHLRVVQHHGGAFSDDPGVHIAPKRDAGASFNQLSISDVSVVARAEGFDGVCVLVSLSVARSDAQIHGVLAVVEGGA